MRAVMIAGVLAACGSRDRDAPAPEVRAAKLAATVAPVEQPVRTLAPHSGGISLAAVADRGTAAITGDDLGQLRLWPTLDGTREPVVVRGTVGSQIALAPDGAGWLVALLDAVGGIELIRLSLDGEPRGRTVVAPDPGFTQIVATTDGILALQRDQSIVKLDANGRVRGRLVPDDGDRLVAIASRGDRALVVISDHGGQAKTLRWIVPTTDLAWGARIALPRALHASVAIAPTKPWIVGIDAASGEGIVLDIGAAPKPVGEFSSADKLVAGFSIGAPPLVGFVGDDLAMIAQGGRVRWWSPAPASRDPWDATRAVVTDASTVFAVGDGVLLGAQGGTLSLSTRDRTKYLGYGAIGTGSITASENGVVLRTSARTLWLDRALRVLASSKPGADPERTIPITDHIVLIVRQKGGPTSPVMGTDGLLRDTRSAAEVLLGAWGDVDGVSYDEATRVLAVTTSQGTERFRLDPATLTTTRMRSLASATGTTRPLDPKRANGFAAVAYTTNIDSSTNVRWFRELDGPIDQQIQPASQISVPSGSRVLGVDASGAIHHYAQGDLAIVAYAPGSLVVVRKLPTPASTFIGAMDATGTLYAMLTDREVMVIDSAGLTRWRMPIWRPASVQISHDRRTVIAMSAGGLVAFDAVSGRRVAVGCGWDFGLRDAPSPETFNTPNVCADEP